MIQERYTVLLMFSTSHALRAESILELAGIPCKLMPVPRHLSSECGSCVRIRHAEKTPALDVLTTAQLAIAGVHDL